MKRILSVSLAVVALAACSGEPEAPATPASEITSEPATEAPANVPEETPMAPETAEPAEAAVSAIPPAIRGRWGLVPADCTSDRGDAKGLLEVSADQLKFYESVAKLDTVKEAGTSRIRASFDYSGEGQSWKQDVVLDAQDAGKTLIRRDYGPDAMPGPLKYTRCR
jgi:hypothetical protein